jgi:hypothetical protein
MRRRAFARGLAPAALVAALAALPGAPVTGAVQEATPAAGEDRAGVAGATYASPLFGWRLAWDPAVWAVDEAWSRGGTDRLRLGTGSGAGAAAGPSRPSAATAATPALHPAADRLPPGPARHHGRPGGPRPGGRAAADAGRAGVRVHRPGGRARAIREYAECRALAPGEAVLVVDFFAPAETYPEHRRALEALLAAVVLPGVVAPGATPGATPAP